MDINYTVAGNIKRIREEKKLTLNAAAAAAGISRSMLAQIEKGDVNPTISVLWKIANGSKVSFTSLVETGVQPTAVLPADSTPPIIEDEGRYINHPAFAFDEQRLFETYRIEIAPGGFLSAEPHLAGSEEYITLFSGTAEITAGEERHLLHTGDSIRFRADVPHSYRNVGDETVWMNMLIYYG